MPSNEPVCAFCGALPKDDRILVGRNGAVCIACLGKAFQATTQSDAMAFVASGLTAPTADACCAIAAPRNGRRSPFEAPFACAAITFSSNSQRN